MSHPNVEVVRRALEWDPAVLTEDVVWHHQSFTPEFVGHFEGRESCLNDWITIRDQSTAGTFEYHVVNVWPVGDDLVVAHVEVDMAIGGELHHGNSVVVYRVVGGKVVDAFDIPSPSL